MGTWGAGIFDDDLALDVQGDYRDRVIDKLPDDQAEKQVIDRYDTKGEPVFWLALALTQHSVGRLSDRTRDTALGLIDDGTALARFADYAEGDKSLIAARARALAKAADTLRTPQPRRKALRKPKPPPTTNYPWMKGGYYGFVGTDACFVLQVQTVLTKDQLGSYYARVNHPDFVGEPVFCLLDWSGPRLPAKDRLADIPYVLGRHGDGKDLPIRFRPMLLKAGQFPAAAIHDYAHASPAPIDDATADDGGPNWRHFESVVYGYLTA